MGLPTTWFVAASTRRIRPRLVAIQTEFAAVVNAAIDSPLLIPSGMCLTIRATGARAVSVGSAAGLLERSCAMTTTATTASVRQPATRSVGRRRPRPGAATRGARALANSVGLLAARFRRPSSVPLSRWLPAARSRRSISSPVLAMGSGSVRRDASLDPARKGSRTPRTPSDVRTTSTVAELTAARIPDSARAEIAPEMSMPMRAACSAESDATSESGRASSAATAA